MTVAAMSNTRNWVLVLPAVAMCAIALLAEDFQSPDGIEMAAAGRCMWRSVTDPSACLGLEPWLWPPAFPILSGSIAFFSDAGQAARLASLLCAALLMIPLMAMAHRVRGPVAAVGVPLLFVATPALRLHAAAGDARTLGLLGLLGAWALATHDKGRGWTIGALAGLAGLSRPEGIFAVALLLGWVAWRRRRLLLRSIVAFGVMMGPWWTALSLINGQPSLTGRGWISRAYGWMSVMPNDWIIQELGVGARNTPLRIALSSTTASAMTQDTFDPVAGGLWLAQALILIVPGWLLLLAGIGIFATISAKRKGILEFSTLFCGLALAMGLFVQTQDDQIPANNLLPVLVVLVLMAGIGVQHITSRTKPAVGLAIATTCLAFGISRSDGFHLNQASTLTATSRWLQTNTDSDTVLAATLKSAQIVHEANRRRTRFPSPWSARTWNHSPERAALLIVTNLDVPEVNASLRTLGEQGDLALIAYTHNTDGWAAIFEVSK